MTKQVKCLLLKIDTVLITEIIQVEPEELGEPDCKLTNPYQYFGEDDLRPWPEVTYQTELKIHSDSILTIADPKPEIVEKYLELTA